MMWTGVAYVYIFQVKIWANTVALQVETVSIFVD